MRYNWVWAAGVWVQPEYVWRHDLTSDQLCCYLLTRSRRIHYRYMTLSLGPRGVIIVSALSLWFSTRRRTDTMLKLVILLSLVVGKTHLHLHVTLPQIVVHVLHPNVSFIQSIQDDLPFFFLQLKMLLETDITIYHKILLKLLPAKYCVRKEIMWIWND